MGKIDGILKKFFDRLKFYKETMEYFGRNEERFYEDVIFFNAMLVPIEQIGEMASASKISTEYKMEHSEVEWKKISALRNIAIHEYGRIDRSIVWEVITEDIPVLERQVKRLVEIFEN